MGKAIGLSEEELNSALNKFNTDASNVMEELTESLQEVLKEIAANWGTKDAVTYVGEKLIPSFDELQKNVARTIKEIGTTVRSTGIQQAQDTNNSISPIAVNEIEVGTLTNETQEKLPGGKNYIGVYNTLESDVAKANSRLKDSVTKKLDNLKRNLINNCQDAFTDEGTSKVAETCETYIGQVKTAIDQALETTSESITQLTKSATQFAKDIQSSGLRAASGTGA